MLRWRFGAPERFTHSLDFGCGVGQLLLPLARCSETAHGVDVSPTMLEHCRRHAAEQNVTNIVLHLVEDSLSSVEHLAGRIDLLTTFIVLQHIPPRRGCKILADLLRLLSPGGYAFIHLTFATAIENLHYEAANVTGSKYGFYQRTADGLMKLVEQLDPEVQIQMNHYNLNEVMCLLYQAGIPEVVTRFTNHANILGVELYFKNC
jgi:cyclopropane fatty-acyl-phospholipid synthase-like methyltransferase